MGHVLFLESPAGVGFSYATDGNITTDDDQVAKDNYNSLVYITILKLNLDFLGLLFPIQIPRA